MKFATLLLATVPAIASANVVSLNDSNYEEITSEKSLVFIKFFAPWCGHCKAMADDWIQLGESMAEEKPDLLIAEIDCTAEESESLCEDHGIEGFPTLKYGDPSFLDSYDGAREYDEMYSFATTGLKASCSPKNIDSCSDEEKETLEKILAMSIEDLEADIQAYDDVMEKEEEEFESSTEVLEEEYMAMMEESNKAKSEAKAASNYDILKSVQALKSSAASGNDEL